MRRISSCRNILRRKRHLLHLSHKSFRIVARVLITLYGISNRAVYGRQRHGGSYISNCREGDAVKNNCVCYLLRILKGVEKTAFKNKLTYFPEKHFRFSGNFLLPVRLKIAVFQQYSHFSLLQSDKSRVIISVYVNWRRKKMVYWETTGSGQSSIAKRMLRSVLGFIYVDTGCYVARCMGLFCGRNGVDGRPRE